MEYKRHYKICGLLILLAIGFGSCVSVHPPKTYPYEKSKVFNQSYDEVWGKVITWFGNNNMPIKNLEKNSGFISTERQLRADDDFCDCGIIERMAATEDVAKSYANGLTGTFNVVVKKMNDNETKVEINTFFHCSQKLYTYTGSLAEHREIDCNSKGILENYVFEYIEK